MSDWTHLDEEGRASMVDVSQKDVTRRVAVARGRVLCEPETLARFREGTLEKGEALGVARVAGIMAAKATSTAIPLCHPLPIKKVEVRFGFVDSPAAVAVEARVVTVSQTGVEMEALHAANVAALTLYDMAKAIDRGMTLDGFHVAEKTGGRSGDWIHPSPSWSADDVEWA
jgi:cyclic pyranopterin phosphate synthase